MRLCAPHERPLAVRLTRQVHLPDNQSIGFSVGQGSFVVRGMAFPQTRLTLIQRLAANASQADWREFVEDYWGPVCRFAQGRSNLTHEDAEDIATEVFEAISQNRLLERWSKLRSAKLRTLICCVTRNVLSNRIRVETGRVRLVREHGGRGREKSVIQLFAVSIQSAKNDVVAVRAYVLHQYIAGQLLHRRSGIERA